MMSAVDILLSTYNGAAYLTELLNSLLAQEFQDWRLLIRDDCSSDATPEIIGAFVRANPARTVLIPSNEENLGPSRSFSRLMERSDAEFLMFCDQDDLWLPGKISKTLAKMNELVAAYGPALPLLVHCDLQVVDDRLKLREKSFWKFAGLTPENAGRLNSELIMNVVTGCAMMINRAAKDCAVPIPTEAIMHDWWCALVVAGLGKAAFVPEPLILYRQHQSNTLGAKGYTLGALLRKMFRILCDRSAGRKERQHSLCIHYRQAMAFYRLYKDRLTPKQRATIAGYRQLYHTLPVLRFYWLWRYQFWRSGLLRNILFGLCYFNPACLEEESAP